MIGRVDGRVALVSGSARGMGAAHAELLAKEGAKVAVSDVRDELGAEVAERIGGTYYHLDVTQEQDWADVVARIGEELGPITVLVNNAGIVATNPLVETPTEEWQRVLLTNATGVFFGMRAVAKQMAAAGGGAIVNISSQAGLRGAIGLGAYTASKFAVTGITEVAALELARSNIRVASIHPALVRTPMSEGIDIALSTGMLPIPRAGEPEEVARMMLFFVTEATYSTGTKLTPDGGSLIGLIPPG